MGCESWLTYLEILGPDPKQDPTLAARSLPGVTGRCAQRWAVHPDDFDGTVEAADAAEVDYGSVFDMARSTPDGGLLEWPELTRRAPLAFGGAQPFLIGWGTSPHPAVTLREGASGGDAAAASDEAVLVLERLEFFGPDPDGLTGANAASWTGERVATTHESARRLPGDAEWSARRIRPQLTRRSL